MQTPGKEACFLSGLYNQYSYDDPGKERGLINQGSTVLAAKSPLSGRTAQQKRLRVPGSWQVVRTSGSGPGIGSAFADHLSFADQVSKFVLGMWEIGGSRCSMFQILNPRPVDNCFTA